MKVLNVFLCSKRVAFLGVVFLGACSDLGTQQTGVIDGLADYAPSVIAPSSAAEANDVVKETMKSTTEILADPEASFKLSQVVRYTAYNESSVNVTLYAYDSLRTLVARHYIKANTSAEVSVQVPASDEWLSIHWHYHEHVKKEEVGVAELASVSFEGFE